MALKIVRNDLTKMQVDVIVNTANEQPAYSAGTDEAVYKAAGIKNLLEARKNIGPMKAGQVAITPGFRLPATYIIHAVSPRYTDGKIDEESQLRACYRNSLNLAKQYKCKSIAFPLISTGNYGYPKEEGMRIALDEINTFLIQNEMMVYLVVFDDKSTRLGRKIYPNLEEYIDHNYVEEAKYYRMQAPLLMVGFDKCCAAVEEQEAALDARLTHLSDTFQEYLFYLIQEKGLSNSDVYKRAIVTKQLFSKIKMNKNYHPDKTTAMRLCVGAMLNLDETKDLLMRAGYALSSCDKQDIIFSFFIENEIFDMIEIDIALEEYGLPCFIS